MLEHVPVVLRDLIVSLSGFGAGLALYLVSVHIRDRGPWWWAWACARLGFSIIVLLVAEAVFRQPAVPFTWRVGLYIVGLALAAVGYIGIAMQARRRRTKGER